MASSLFTLLDDIATILDDVAAMTKVAAKKTAGVLGDDLALNAEQVSGVQAKREIPVILAVAKGSFKNKLILVPAALIISVLLPVAITPLLMIGGGYLCFEGVEKIVHKFIHPETNEEHAKTLEALAQKDVDMVEFEAEKIKGAVRTDFILSAELIVIALGVVKDKNFMMQAAVVSSIAILMTVGVYSLVAGIVKLDDLGLHLSKGLNTAKQKLGRAILTFAPFLMKTLSYVGTLAMFLVGGEILFHGIPNSHDFAHRAEDWCAQSPILGTFFKSLTPSLLNVIVGLIAGSLILLIVQTISKIKKKELPETV